jgi:molybdopterin converting factor small subunit
MSIKVNIFYPQLKQLIASPDSVAVNGSTVGECLDDLVRQFPGAGSLLFDEQGQLLRQVFAFVNAESTQKINLAEPVKEGDELIIAVLITAG